MKVIISSPYATQSLHGNTISAMRIAGILEESGHDVEVIQSGNSIPKGAGALIALHARKSHTSILAMKQQCPESKIILYLTGTDLYGDIPEGCPLAIESLSIADAIVVSQDASFNSVPVTYQQKTHVVYNSIILPQLDLAEREPDLFVIASHLRAVKQPFFVVEALGLLDENVRVKLMGSEIDPGSAEQAQTLTQKYPGFEWLGEQTYPQALTWMKRSIATINTSLSEGGANSIGESIMLGRPVIASRIEGNIGMLGEGYDGYFDPHSPAELASLIQKVTKDPSYLSHLEQQVLEQSAKYSRQNESKGWLALL